MNKEIVVVGATGEVGKRLVKKLIAQNQNTRIHLLVRRHSSSFSDVVQQHVIDFADLENFKLDTTFDLAYCCLGTTIKQAGSKAAFKYVDHELVMAFAKWCQQHDCQKLACISAVGANVNSKNFYLSVKGQTEQDLIQMGWKSLWLIRPSLLLGQRDEFRLGEYFGGLLGRIVSPFMQGALKKYQPIQMSQVAQALASLNNEASYKEGNHILQGHALFKA